MKLLSAEQFKALDQHAIDNEPIESIKLMERASENFTRWFIAKFNKTLPVTIFCGPGNNGGDGLAIARLLRQKMYTVKVYKTAHENPTKDFLINEEQFIPYGKISTITSKADIPSLSNTIIIDALFGIGINKPIEGIYADIIEAINQSDLTVVAVDIPSGLYLDKQNASTKIIKADYTITFQFPKLAFLLPQNDEYVGEWYALHIGLSRPFADQFVSTNFFSDEGVIRSKLKKRKKYSHKGNYGKCLLIAGSYGMMGAAVLSTKACLRAGGGLVYAYVPESGFFVLQNDLPEAMVFIDEHPEIITSVPENIETYDAIGIGPGLGIRKETAKAFENILAKVKKPMVIDASALALIASSKNLISKIPHNSILTPHLGEFEKLFGTSLNDYDRLEKAKAFCKTNQLYLIIKGAHAVLVTPEGMLHFNSTGNPGMATAGSGDVLTGIITSLLGQGYSPEDASILGMYLHGYAGDAAARRFSQQSMLASDIIDGISQFYKDFQ